MSDVSKRTLNNIIIATTIIHCFELIQNWANAHSLTLKCEGKKDGSSSVTSECSSIACLRSKQSFVIVGVVVKSLNKCVSVTCFGNELTDHGDIMIVCGVAPA